MEVFVVICSFFALLATNKSLIHIICIAIGCNDMQVKVKCKCILRQHDAKLMPLSGHHIIFNHMSSIRVRKRSKFANTLMNEARLHRDQQLNLSIVNFAFIKLFNHKKFNRNNHNLVKVITM